MEIRNRLFPYPVLCEDTDDYVEGEFHVEASLVEQGLNDIVVRFDINLDNPGLQSLINTGKAEFVIHLECSNTAFRTVIRTFSNTEKYRIMNSRVNGNISLLAMIVSTENIGHYSNPSLNEDYEGITLNVSKASILAYENMPPIHIAKNYEELAEKDSIFSIVKQTRLDKNERKPISFGLDSDRIKIYVDEEVYASYIRYKGMQSLMMSLLVMPALTYMLETLVRDGHEQYESAYWFIKLQKFYKLRGMSFVDDIIEEIRVGNVLISEEVQEMLQLPISATMLSISSMLGE